MGYTRHRRFLVKKHRYRKDTMNKYFNNQAKPQLDEPERTRYRENVFGMVKDMEVEFRKKKEETVGTTTRNRKRDKMEEPYVPFLLRRSRFSSSTCCTRKH